MTEQNAIRLQFAAQVARKHQENEALKQEVQLLKLCQQFYRSVPPTTTVAATKTSPNQQNAQNTSNISPNTPNTPRSLGSSPLIGQQQGNNSLQYRHSSPPVSRDVTNNGHMNLTNGSSGRTKQSQQPQQQPQQHNLPHEKMNLMKMVNELLELNAQLRHENIDLSGEVRKLKNRTVASGVVVAPSGSSPSSLSHLANSRGSSPPPATLANRASPMSTMVSPTLELSRHRPRRVTVGSPTGLSSSSSSTSTAPPATATPTSTAAAVAMTRDLDREVALVVSDQMTLDSLTNALLLSELNVD